MIAFVPAPGRLLIAAGLLALALTACGRRGALEAPPDPAVVAAQKQREEQRRLRQGGGATVGQTELRPIAQTNRLEGQSQGPEDEGDDLPSILPSPAPTPRVSGGRRRGYVIPQEPFFLDPLL